MGLGERVERFFRLMSSRPPSRGFTILELIVVMTITAVLLGLAVPPFLRLRDASSVHAAMADLAAEFDVARQSALNRRAIVAVVVDTARGFVRVRAGVQAIRQSDFRTSYGVSLSSNRDSAVYDARGLGYGLSNLTVTIRRGTFVDTLTMSRLGRIRW